MTIILVAAHDPNLVIGKDGGLPWHYPEDLKHFKQTTLGGTVIMGRGVFEELSEIPLPKRRNIVLSTTKSYENVESFNSLETALETVDKNQVFIIGGSILYRRAMEIADKMIITEIHKEYEGDTYFPEYRSEIGSVWNEVSRVDSDEFSFIEYERM